jgi:hypothetical protein
MREKLNLLLYILFILLVSCSGKNNNQYTSFVWNFNNIEQIGQYKTKVTGSPVVIETPMGPAIEFDGKDDALFLETHPLAGFEEFTVEIIFRPDAGGLAEQRFFHMHTNDTNRVIIETRLTGDQWFFDTFIKSGKPQKTLYSEMFLHPLGKWYHVALTYKDTKMSHYVNGFEELTGNVKFIPVNEGTTSIGCRINQIYWFKGAIHKIRIASKAIPSENFALLPFIKN